MARDEAVPWMDAAFALDELHQDLDFRAMAAEVDALEQPKSPVVTVGLDTLSTFLSEMEQLDDDGLLAVLPQHETASSASWKLVLDLEDPAAALAAAAGASVAMENRNLKTMSKKKKMSSSQRTKRDKLALEDTISQLETEIKRISAEYKKQLAPINDRWKPIIRHELYQMERVTATQRRLHRLIQTQQGKSAKVRDLLAQMRTQMLGQAPVQVSPCLQFDTTHDAAMFALLEQNLVLKYQQLDEQIRNTPFPVLETDTIETCMAPDGKSMDLSFSRIMPFDVLTVSNTAWTWGRAEFGSSHIGLVFKKTIDTMAVKQEFVVHSPDHDQVKMQLRVVCKRFVSENHAVVQWEGMCDYGSSSDSAQTTTVHETGWVLMQPLEHDDRSSAMSVIRSSVHITPNSSDVPWIHTMLAWGDLAKMMMPSSPQAMIDRHQCVENRLLNASRLKRKAR